MAKKKLGHPCWFKLWHRQRTVFEAADDAAVGQAVKAALLYLETGEKPKLDGSARLVFAGLCQDVDDARNDYRLKSKAGSEGNSRRWGKVSECDTGRYSANPSDTLYRKESQGIEKPEASYRDKTPAPGFDAGEQGWMDPAFAEYIRQGENG